MKVKIINKSNNPNPEYATAGSAGFDIRASLAETIKLLPEERKLIPTGLFFKLPEGYEAQIRPRSGLALKHGVTVLNSPGTLDSDYTMECFVLLYNSSNVEFSINNSDRIAQMVIAKYEKVEFEPVEVLEETERIGGFGSTGTN